MRRDREAMLKTAVERASTPVYLTSKSAIVEYYKDKFGTKWATQAAKDLAGTTDTKSRAYKSARRNFEGARVSQEGNTSKWKEFGKSLPSLGRKPSNGQDITVTIKGTQDRGGKRPGTRDRVVSVTFSGTNAYSFVNDPKYSDIWDDYGFNFDEDEDGDYALSIQSVSAS